MKIRRSTFVFCLCLLLMLSLTGCSFSALGKLLARGEEKPTAAEKPTQAATEAPAMTLLPETVPPAEPAVPEEEPADIDVRKLYIPCVEKLIEEEVFFPHGNAMLYDMDSDGIQELITVHQHGEEEDGYVIDVNYVYSIYDVLDDTVIAKRYCEPLNSAAGDPRSFVGMVEFEGKIMFFTHSANASDVGGYTTNTLYDPNSLEVAYSEKTDVFNASMEGVKYLDMLDEGHGAMEDYRVSGMPLDVLLEYLNAL